MHKLRWSRLEDGSNGLVQLVFIKYLKLFENKTNFLNFIFLFLSLLSFHLLKSKERGEGLFQRVDELVQMPGFYGDVPVAVAEAALQVSCISFFFF